MLALHAVTTEEMDGFDPDTLAGGHTDQETVDRVVNDWEQRAHRAATRAVGQKTIRKGVSKKWFDDVVKRAIADRRKQHAAWLGSGSVKDWTVYCKLRHEVHELVRAKKREGWTDLIDNVAESFGNNKRLFWSLVKRLGPKKKDEQTTAVINRLGQHAKSPEDRREAWADFYEDLGKVVPHANQSDTTTSLRH